ncbi:MAG TPA: hypothetical protein VLA82_13560 [Actinomycetota bacterium]|nr:hypothetical protein [Actinomycetota bacterium]
MSTVLERPRTYVPDSVERDDLLSRYLRALDRYGDPEPRREELPAGADVRTCASCGETTLFRLDPEGGWAFCTACRKAA